MNWARCAPHGHRWDQDDELMEAGHEAGHNAMHPGEPFTVIPTKPLFGEEPAAPSGSALERVGARDLGDIDRSAAPLLVVNRIAPEGHTMLFGPGNAGKGLLTCSWVEQHVDEGGRVLLLDFEDHPEEWARRLWGLGGVDMFEGTPVRHISPLRTAFDKDGVRWHELALAAREHEATLIVIDSIAYAIPGLDPSEPKAATAYSSAIQQFGLPVLSLAHMNRAGDDRYPFGSVFWHAGARLTWSLVPDGDRGSKLNNRKHNNYEWRGAYRVTSDWLDDIPREVHEKPYNVTVAQRIADYLRAGPMTLGVLEAMFAGDEGGEPVKRNSILQALRRGLTATPKVWTTEGDHWVLVPKEEAL
jgi:AAA domain-containing protein